jgi:histone H3/H4
MFERYIEAMQKTGDYLLAWQFQKEQMKARLLDNAEIDRIAERVLERISIRIEAEAIEQLRNMLNSLGE